MMDATRTVFTVGVLKGFRIAIPALDADYYLVESVSIVSEGALCLHRLAGLSEEWTSLFTHSTLKPILLSAAKSHNHSVSDFMMDKNLLVIGGSDA